MEDTFEIAQDVQPGRFIRRRTDDDAMARQVARSEYLRGLRDGLQKAEDIMRGKP